MFLNIHTDGDWCHWLHCYNSITFHRGENCKLSLSFDYEVSKFKIWFIKLLHMIYFYQCGCELAFKLLDVNRCLECTWNSPIYKWIKILYMLVMLLLKENEKFPRTFICFIFSGISTQGCCFTCVQVYRMSKTFKVLCHETQTCLFYSINSQLFFFFFFRKLNG